TWRKPTYLTQISKKLIFKSRLFSMEGWTEPFLPGQTYQARVWISQSFVAPTFIALVSMQHSSTWLILLAQGFRMRRCQPQARLGQDLLGWISTARQQRLLTQLMFIRI